MSRQQVMHTCRVGCLTLAFLFADHADSEQHEKTLSVRKAPWNPQPRHLTGRSSLSYYWVFLLLAFRRLCQRCSYP